MTFREIARRMVDRAREEIRADLAAQRYPDAVPVPIADHLASLPALPPPDDEPDDDGEDPDNDEIGGRYGR